MELLEGTEQLEKASSDLDRFRLTREAETSSEDRHVVGDSMRRGTGETRSGDWHGEG